MLSYYAYNYGIIHHSDERRLESRTDMNVNVFLFFIVTVQKPYGRIVHHSCVWLCSEAPVYVCALKYRSLTDREGAGFNAPAV